MSQAIINAVNAWKSNPELYRLDNSSLYDGAGNIKSASNWTEKHMNSLHILYELDKEIIYELQVTPSFSNCLGDDSR